MKTFHLNWGGGYSKSEVDTLLTGKADSSHTHTKSQITDFPTIPSKTSDLTNDSGFLTSHQDLSGYIPKSGGAVMTGDNLARTVDNSLLKVCGGTAQTSGGTVAVYGKDTGILPGTVVLQPALSSSSYCNFILYPDGTATWGGKNLAMQEDTIPRSGGAVISGNTFSHADTYSEIFIYSGTQWDNGGYIELYGGNTPYSQGTRQGQVIIGATSNGTHSTMNLRPDGTWTWGGTAVQITSDQRLKQQISKIDNALLDAWEEVELVQFKYNDAVDQKGDKARLHTGYVVQQIDEACQKHDVYISAYGLYCHEEYPERTEEVEVEQEDGTTSKETKVIEEASEHYSLRYTETLVVECAYLRRENARLKTRLDTLENRLEQLEQSLK